MGQYSLSVQAVELNSTVASAEINNVESVKIIDGVLKINFFEDFPIESDN